MKPWALADKWMESDPGGWIATADYNPATGDTYTAPTTADPGTGFTLDNDLGAQLALKSGTTINPGWFQPVSIGGSTFAESISSCMGPAWRIGDSPMNVPFDWTEMREGTDDLIALDPLAEWDATSRKVIHSCVESNSCVDSAGDPIVYPQSPRIVSVPVFDLAQFMATGGPGAGQVHMVNVVALFVERVDEPNTAVVARLALKSDVWSPGAGSITSAASFIKAIQLVR
jgi:hypothetical protein